MASILDLRSLAKDLSDVLFHAKDTGRLEGFLRKVVGRKAIVNLPTGTIFVYGDTDDPKDLTLEDLSYFLIHVGEIDEFLLVRLGNEMCFSSFVVEDFGQIDEGEPVVFVVDLPIVNPSLDLFVTPAQVPTPVSKPRRKLAFL